ncbi:MAG: formylglycine-generating enzyme family protein [Acidobacteriota bacterium]|nr:formylglycine-generating enzyme family protein [Acidobacteriota bacterium]
MLLRLEKCPICQSAPPQPATKGELCAVCRAPFIFIEYFLDKYERERHKTSLIERRKRWKELNGRLKKSLRFHKEKWSHNAYWSDIWRQIQDDAVALNFDEPATVKLAQSISAEIEIGDGATFSDNFAPVAAAAAPPPKPPETPAEKLRREIATWVGGLSDAEYNIVEWVDFTDSLGADLDFDELGEIRDRELERQFINFETISISSEREFYNRQLKSTRRLVETLDGGIEITMIKISGGSFEMGDEGWSHTKPRHPVKLSDFYIGMTPVTQLQWNAVARLPKIKLELESNPSHFRGMNDLPVDSVGWLEAVEFCERLSKWTGRKYRLPSEAEWEYAASAGSADDFAFGEVLTPALANYSEEISTDETAADEIRDKTLPVETFWANAFGLYDMHGNVWEWCADAWHKDYSGAPADGKAWTDGGESGRRVLRGGAWCNWAELCRARERIGEREDKEGKLNYIGFRLALDL